MEVKTDHDAQRAAACVRSAASVLGRLGGRVKSERKAAAARANGAKGGRPRKVPAEPPKKPL